MPLRDAVEDYDDHYERELASRNDEKREFLIRQRLLPAVRLQALAAIVTLRYQIERANDADERKDAAE